MARHPLYRETTVLVEVTRGSRGATAKLSIGRLGRFIHNDEIPKAALAVRQSWWRVRRLGGGRFEFLEMVEEPVHILPPRVERSAPPSTYGRSQVEWAGVGFVAVGLHDGGMFRGWPGLFGLVRREPNGRLTLLFVDAVEDLANGAGPSHAVWSAAVSAGASELHVVIVEGPRVDRLGLASRIVRHIRPELNQPGSAQQEEESWPARDKARS